MLRSPTLLLVALVAASSGCGSRDDATRPDAAGADVVTVGDIRYTASTVVLESYPVQLRTTVRARATGAPRTLEIGGGCEVFLRAYHDDQLVWDQQRAVFCTMQLQRLTVPADTDLVLGTSTDAAEILGDSLPDGSYRLEALVNRVGGGVPVPAGSVELSVPR